ncbi:taste receptor type 2 member 40-like [Ranitomeya variabilis]|uniref:taste receptor type 2 member 40-like n=1 Tax=Ranitomeya variabilis TaxID=490064 RepID=UPI004055F872
MEASIQNVLAAILTTECLVGFTVTLIILADNFMKWKRLNSLKTSDKILSSLAMTRVLYFSSIILWTSVFHSLSWLENIETVLSAIYIVAIFTIHTSHWFATILCVFYCVKIVTYNNKLLVFLKTRISTMVPWLMLASLLISLISSLPLIWFGYDVNLQNFSNVSTENTMEKKRLVIPNVNNQIMMFSLGSFLPLMILCVALIMLIHFLLIHTRRMRSAGSQNHSPNLKFHFSALKTISFLLLLQIMFLISMSLFASGLLFNYKYYVLSFHIIICSPPFFHSLYLISSSNELFNLKCLCFRNHS